MTRASQFFLLRELVRRDFSQRYAGSLFGFAWSFIQPLWQMLLLSYVFSIILRIPLDSEPTDRFWVFLFCGLLPWAAIQEGIQRSTTTILEHAEMVKKIRFPAEILVVSVVTTALLHQAITLAVFLIALVAVGELAPLHLVVLPFALFFQVVLTLGIGYFLAAVQVYFRDTVQVLGLVMNAWFYLTPIVYPLSIVPERYHVWVRANPLALLVELYRYSFLGGDEGRLATGIAALAATTIALFAFGLLLFRRLKSGFSDEI